METKLCYEVWVETADCRPGETNLVASYWNVQDAWNVAEGINKTGYDASVIVANGMQIDVTNGKRCPRIDVI